MGLLDRLFGTGASRTPAPPTRTPSQPAPVRKPQPEVKPQPVAVTAEETKPQPAPDIAEQVVAPAPAVVETVEAAEAAEQPPVEVAAEPAAEEVPAEPTAEPVEAVEETTDTAITPHLQARLDTYFARLRREFPDGHIVRLNTGHKKLAERGAELRRLIGYEGRLDDFFALGGFTYQRSAGGRPPLPTAQTDSVEERLREAFPDDVPTTLAVRQADARLYLDLRAAARREGCTVGEFLNRFRAD